MSQEDGGLRVIDSQFSGEFVVVELPSFLDDESDDAYKSLIQKVSKFLPLKMPWDWFEAKHSVFRQLDSLRSFSAPFRLPIPELNWGPEIRFALKCFEECQNSFSLCNGQREAEINVRFHCDNQPFSWNRHAVLQLILTVKVPSSPIITPNVALCVLN